MRNDTVRMLDDVRGPADLATGSIRAIAETDRRLARISCGVAGSGFAVDLVSKLSLRRSMPYAGILASSIQFPRSGW